MMLTELLLKQSVGAYNPMMAFGYFIFNLYTTPYQTNQHDKEWRFPSNSRVGARPVYQFLGPGEEKITLGGVLMPEISGGRVSLELLDKMGDTGKAYPLIEGSGVFYGLFTVGKISKTKTEFFNDGTSRRIEFSAEFTRVDDKNRGLLGVLDVSDIDLGSTLGGLL